MLHTKYVFLAFLTFLHLDPPNSPFPEMISLILTNLNVLFIRTIFARLGFNWLNSFAAEDY
jgi:hypothetical protein